VCFLFFNFEQKSRSAEHTRCNSLFLKSVSVIIGLNLSGENFGSLIKTTSNSDNGFGLMVFSMGLFEIFNLN